MFKNWLALTNNKCSRKSLINTIIKMNCYWPLCQLLYRIDMQTGFIIVSLWTSAFRKYLSCP